MVVGWQYLEIPGTGYRDDLFDNRPVFEIGLQEKWYYFGQDGALLEQTDKQVLEAKTSEIQEKYMVNNILHLLKRELIILIIIML